MPESVHDVTGPMAVASEADMNGEASLVAALRRGEEGAFVTLLERHHTTLIRLALLYVDERAIAEEVVQETWYEVVRHIDRFAGRSTLKTWICAILVNRAKSRAVRERRSIAFSRLACSDDASNDGPIASDRFDAAGWWASAEDAPRPWPTLPEEHALGQEIGARIAAAMAALSPQQRRVLRLRDVEGWSAMEVCNVLALSETNQRVLLHRARARVRGALERYFAED